MLSAQEAKNQIAKALVDAGLPTSRYNFQEKQGGIILAVALREKIEIIKIKKRMTQDEVDYIKGMISTFGRRMS